MNASLLLLLVCYAIVAILLLALCVATRWSVWIKTASIVVVTGFFALTYEALTGMLGFPSPGRLPPRFVFHDAVISQPDPATGDKGSISLWISTLTENGPARHPRAYEIPFDKQTYEVILESRRRAKEGIVQMGTVRSKAVPPDAKSVLSRFLSSSRTQTLNLQDLPAPALPEK